MLEQQLTPDETSAAARILNSEPAVLATAGDIEQYIAIINEERARPTADDLSGMTDADLASYMQALSKRKK